MHGRPRKAPTPEDEKASALKAAKLRSLQSQFLQNHHNKIYTKEAVEISAKLLEANPEYYTAWNYRKLAVDLILNQSGTHPNSDSIKSIFDEELRVVENALKKNYKSYGAWYHRKWVLSKGHSSTDHELQLLNQYQKVDSRNFHAWNYRRFIAKLKNISDDDELKFTTDMIYNNFSNYSAWHNRSVLLSHLLEKKVERYFPKENVLTEEYEFVRNALFTDPDDQSGWFYHLWLLDQTVKQETPLLVSSCPPSDVLKGGSVDEKILWREENFSMCKTHFQESIPLNSFHQLKISEDNEPTTFEWSAKTIANEIAHCRELLSLMDCKIGKLTLARLLMAHDALMSYKSPNAVSVAHSDEVLELYHNLMKLDTAHAQYYKDEYSSVLLKQVTSSRESLLGYCHKYRGSASLSSNHYVCLRLNNLSLSRIGSFERLLWVQMLDLSHNQLPSIEGLEGMQLLSCLNLSNNYLGSFTALEPLRLLKSLKVLDISYNEIGARSIDTRRYLCSSPLSHSVGSDWNMEEFLMKGVEVTNYWEAFSVFRGLNLIQLDIVGNAVADEQFKLFLFKLFPTLRWLDGEELH